MLSAKPRPITRHKWRWPPVTICIAAKCEDGKTAILAADQRIGMEFVEADIGLKITWLHKNWYVLLAGDDLSAAHEVCEAARQLSENDGPYVPLVRMRNVLCEAYQSVRMRRAETEYLISRGWRLDEFKQRGLSSFPLSTFSEIDGAIQRYDLRVDVLACGFYTEEAELIQVGNPGIASLETHSGFAAIGTGSISASTSLFVRRFNQYMSLPEALYCVYEAKRAAEYAAGVGQPTHIMIVRRDAGIVGLFPSDTDVLSTVWGELKPKEWSDAQLQRISALPKIAGLLSPPDATP